MTRQVDQNWRKIQETTFTNWVNNSLRGHLKTAKNHVSNLQTDLQDGLVLIQLLETISSPKKVGVVNRNPVLKIQKLENLGACFRFFEKEKIKLVGMGPENIYNGDMVFILGLIWTLIRKYQIGTGGEAGLSTKKAMLAWVNTQIPDQNIRNFSTDWNDGVALCALVDRIQPGLCPHYATLDRGKKVGNCELGMRLAEDKLGIPKILEPSILSNPDVDDLSVMTYLSYFCKPANKRLMKWIQGKIPDRKVTNFKTDWNNGINLACLADAINPGIFSDARNLDPHDALDNLVRALRVAEDHLAVKPILKASEMADPNVEELNVTTYLFRFQYAKPVPQPHEVTCSGHGLHKAFVGRPAQFEVQASRAGVGDLVVTIKGPGRSIPAEITASKEHRGVFNVQYSPSAAGKLSIDIKWSGFEIPSSPFTVDVLDPAAFSFTGPQITGGQSARVGRPVIMHVKGLVDVSDLYVLIQHPDAHTEVAKIVPKGSGEAEVTYTPVRVGKDEVFAKVAGTELPGSPFEVRVVDPTQCSVSLTDPPLGKPLAVNQKATFTVNASDANIPGIVAEARTPVGVQELSMTRLRDGRLTGTFTPVEVGLYSIVVTCAGEDVRGSPLDLQVSDASKCVILDNVPQYMQVGEQLKLNVSTKHAGPGQLTTHSSSAGILKSSLRKVDKELFALSLHSSVVGQASVDLQWNEANIPQTPFTVSVCDSSKCSAYGQNLIDGKGKVGESFGFTVQTSQAGKGELIVKPKGPKSTYKPSIKPNHDDTYTVNFTSNEQGPHVIEILWGNAPITNSPYKVQFTKGADAGLFTATGEGLKTAVALEAAKCMLVGPEVGLVEDGALVVEVAGQQLHSKLVKPSTFNPKCGQLVVSVTDNANGSYAIQYAAPIAGIYTLSITSDGKHIPGSPFKVDIYPPPDASKCLAYGPAIDNPHTQVVGKPLEFKVDSTDAGTGQLSIAASSPVSTSMPVYLAEDRAGQGKRAHSVKVEPKVQGKHVVHVLWAGQHTPGSPFNFDVSDPQNVRVLNLPDSEGFTARVGEVFTFTVDPRKAGKGEVKATAQREAGRTEPFTTTPKQDGTIDLSYIPQNAGKMELLLTFSGVSLLHLPWTCHIVNPGRYNVIPPQGYGRQREYVKFVVGGLTKKNQKEVQLTAVHKDHNAAVKVDFGVDGQAVARFTAKMKGPYTVEAKCAKKHVQGSPFTVQVANPDGCVIKGAVPKVIPVGQTRLFSVDAADAGPGELTCTTQSPSGGKSSCLECEIQTQSISHNILQVIVKGLTCAECYLVLNWAGYAISGTPAKVKVVDPEKCSFLCPQVKSGNVKQGQSILVTVDTSKGGSSMPEVVAKGPKARYPVDMRESKPGKYNATFEPWQDGDHILEVYVGGVHVSGSPMSFEVLKPVDPTKITISGPGLRQAVANRSTEVTVFARESKLFDRGLLMYEFTPEQEGVAAPKAECLDNGNGTYKLTYIPQAPGNYKLNIQGEGTAITGSPFFIQVKPEPNAGLCIASGRMIDNPEMSYVLRDTVELTVDSTDAGFGTLALSGTQPDGQPFNVFTREERIGSKDLHFIKFDAAMVGNYKISAKWDNEHIPGSPYTIQVTDPFKCVIEGQIPRYMVLGKTDGFLINTTGAGSGKLDVSLTYLQENPPVEAFIEEVSSNSYQVRFSALVVGEAKVTITIGQQKVPKTPFVVSVCDPSKCVIDSQGLKTVVGVPLKIPVSTNGAGAATIVAQPVDPESQWKVNARDVSGGGWEVSCTASSVGQQNFHILYAGIGVPGSPIAITASDPRKCVVSGLHKNFVTIMGHPISFSVDYSQAGSGELQVKVKLPDGSMEDPQREDHQGITDFTYIPRQPGKLEVTLGFSGHSIQPSPWACTVTDPSHFQVTPPTSYIKLKHSVRFSITGITETSEDISVMAFHGGSSSVLKTEPSDESGAINAQFVPQSIGEFTIHVKHMDEHIDGSPFNVLVANPDGCTIMGRVPNTLQVGEDEHLDIDASTSGPGDLSCTTEDITGEMGEIVEVLKLEEQGKYRVRIGSETIGTSRIIMRWAGYVIPKTPFEVKFVDAGKVSWSCSKLEHGHVKQGDVLELQLECTNAGNCVPEVKASGPKTSYPTEIVDNEDGTFTIRFHPWQIGDNCIEILWGGTPIPKSPVSYRVVKAIEARAITASGGGLHNAIAGRPAKVKITTPEVGLLERGDLHAGFELDPKEGGSDTELPKVELSDRSDGTYSLTYLVPFEGNYRLAISCEDEPIAGSPFIVHVYRPPSAANCKAFGGALEAEIGLRVKDPIQFSVDTTDAGQGHLMVMATHPNERSIAVYALEENKAKRKLQHLKLDPESVGHHTVNVLWEDEHIPGSPFDFNVINPSNCVVTGLPLPNGIMQLSEDVQFMVHFGDAGHDVTPEVFVNLTGEGAPLSLDPSPTSDTTYAYSYTADTAGNAYITVQYGGHDVAGSPFKCQVIDSSRLYVTGLSLNNGYAYTNDPFSFSIIGKLPGDHRLAVTAHGPSNDPNVVIVQEEDGMHVATFVPAEPGSYEVFVECAGTNVSGSPFTVQVADWSKCQVLGDIPTILQVGKPIEFVVKTRLAGAGELAALVDHNSENQFVDCFIEKQASDTYVVTMLGKRTGEVKEVELLWAGHNIPQCPFKVTVCDASQCKVYGQALKTKKGKVSEPVTFTVVTLHAGNGDLVVVPRGPSAQYSVDIQKTKEATYEVSFTPWEVGQNLVQVLWGGAEITNSPFLINVESLTSTSICNATGEGLSRAIAGEPASFTVISNETGLLDKNVFKITIFGPGVHATADVKMTDNNNGTYTVQYTAPVPGGYVASILFHDRPIPGSPFKVNVVPGPDASKCRAYGAALHPNATNISGTLEFYVDTSKGGDGNLKVFIQGPNDYRPEVYMANDIKKKGVYSIKFDAKKSGRYMILVLWSKQHIPGSPFKLKVHPQPNAGKVRAYGPGLEGGMVGDGGDFTVETKNAGLGTLLIRVHGLKDSFKIEATPKSPQEPRILLARYNPQLPGDYVVFVRWSGEHVPGSPFKVTIHGHSEEEETTTGMSGSGFDAAEGFADTEDLEDDSYVGSFARQRPRYDIVRKPKKATQEARKEKSPEAKPQTKKASKKEQPKSKDRKKEKDIPRSPSGGPVGPVVPSLKMKPMASLGGMSPEHKPQGYTPRALEPPTTRPRVSPKQAVEPQKQAPTGRPRASPKKGGVEPQRQAPIARPRASPSQGGVEPQRQAPIARPRASPSQGGEVVYLRTPGGGFTPVYIRDEPEDELPKRKVTAPAPEKQPDKKHRRHGSAETGVPKKPEEERKRRRPSSTEAKPSSLPPQSTSPRQSSSPPQGPPPAMSRGAGRPRADSKKKKRSSKEYS